MIRLFDEEREAEGRQSSKGNQLKFRRDAFWYKADYLGYEGLAEYVISELLALSNLKEEEYVTYTPEQIEYNGTCYNGCKSRDFTDGWNLITLERLFQQMYGQGLNRMIYAVEDHTERLKLLVDQVERVTGLRKFGNYMCKLLTIDALFLNEDRHTQNIAVMTNDRKEFKLAPIFDNGAGLLSDTMMDYPMREDIFSLIPRVRAKTFCNDFDEQLDIAETLYGDALRFRFTYWDVQAIVERADIYDAEIRKRVIDLVMQMKRKYAYLFGE